MFEPALSPNSNSKIFDAHLHIIDPRFPLFENQGYTPQAFTVDDYLSNTQTLDLCGGAIVSGSFQKQDQSYLVDALKQLGSSFVGVTQLLHTATDEEILTLNKAGVRAVRFNLKRGGSEELSHLESFAARVYELANWHVELYIDAIHLAELNSTLQTLPSISIDHLGLSRAGLPLLYRLAENGVRVKATGFGRLDFEPEEAVKQLYSINPRCLMFGTDMPSTRAPRPFRPEDIALIESSLDEEAAARVLYKNALEFYRLI